MSKDILIAEVQEHIKHFVEAGSAPFAEKWERVLGRLDGGGHGSMPDSELRTFLDDSRRNGWQRGETTLPKVIDYLASQRGEPHSAHADENASSAQAGEAPSDDIGSEVGAGDAQHLPGPAPAEPSLDDGITIPTLPTVDQIPVPEFRAALVRHAPGQVSLVVQCDTSAQLQEALSPEHVHLVGSTLTAIADGHVVEVAAPVTTTLVPRENVFWYRDWPVGESIQVQHRHVRVTNPDGVETVIGDGPLSDPVVLGEPVDGFTTNPFAETPETGPAAGSVAKPWSERLNAAEANMMALISSAKAATTARDDADEAVSAAELKLAAAKTVAADAEAARKATCCSVVDEIDGMIEMLGELRGEFE